MAELRKPSDNTTRHAAPFVNFRELFLRIDTAARPAYIARGPLFPMDEHRTPATTKDSFGEHLRREREMRGVTLDEITAATRIGTRFLEAFENEQWDRLPGGVFNRGFVRSIAHYLGLDEENLLAEYIHATSGLTKPSSWVAHTHPAAEPDRALGARSRRSTCIGGARCRRFVRLAPLYAKHVIGCSSGTDALLLVLMAWQIGPGDAVICPAFTFCATAEVVALIGAMPVMADVAADTFNLDPASFERAIATAKQRGLKPKAVIPVDLFGLPADHDAIAAIAAAHGVKVLDDAAQAFGATYRGRKLGTLGDATATSFFPAKPLGCYGDGGAVFTDDDALAARVKSLRVHGENAGDKYDALHIGITGRLDSIQAAVLIEKLKIFPDEIAARQAVAARYAENLAGVATTPRAGNEVDVGVGAIHHPP